MISKFQSVSTYVKRSIVSMLEFRADPNSLVMIGRAEFYLYMFSSMNSVRLNSNPNACINFCDGRKGNN